MKLPVKEHIIIPILIGFVLVIAHAFDLKSLGDGKLGIIPYNIAGLKGILLSPLLHSDGAHLISNLFPLMALIFLSFEFFGKLTYWVLIISWLAVGTLVWMFPIVIDNSFFHSQHIGASGVVYAMAFFLFSAGIFGKKKVLMHLVLLIVVGFGSMIWGIFPEELLGMIDSRISWQSHASGAFVGILLGYIFRKKSLVEDRKFTWQETSTLSEEDEALWNRYLEALREIEEEELREKQQEYIDNYYSKDQQNLT